MATNNIRLGNLTPSKFYLGQNEISKIYLGNNTIYEVGGGGGILPNEYQQVEYIYNLVGGPSIQTGVLFGNDIGVIMKFMETTSTSSSAGWKNIIQGYGGDESKSLYIELYPSTQKYFALFYKGNPKYNINHFDYNVEKIMYIDEGKLKFDNDSYTTIQTGTFTSRYLEITLNQQRVYYVKITKNGELIRNLIPCYRKTDRVAGMFDIVNNVFYENAVEGSTISYGAEVQPISIYDGITERVVATGRSTLLEYSFDGSSSGILSQTLILNVPTLEYFTINNYNIDYTNKKIYIDITAKEVLEDENEYLTITLRDTSGNSDTFTTELTNTIVQFNYEVENISTSYGFFVNADGYYESNNKLVDNSYSLCKLTFNAGGRKLYLDCINNGENNYDFGLLSNIDETLTNSNTADTTNVFKNFKGQSSSSVQTIDYGEQDNSEHFIYIKYRKDSSQSSGNDSLQFKVRIE